MESAVALSTDQQHKVSTDKGKDSLTVLPLEITYQIIAFVDVLQDGSLHHFSGTNKFLRNLTISTLFRCVTVKPDCSSRGAQRMNDLATSKDIVGHVRYESSSIPPRLRLSLY